eukprot:7179306-Pyramimonas_sp.AAC.1
MPARSLQGASPGPSAFLGAGAGAPSLGRFPSGLLSFAALASWARGGVRRSRCWGDFGFLRAALRQWRTPCRQRLGSHVLGL